VPTTIWLGRMSLIGIDLGTSAIKVAAYREDGRPLASARRAVPATRNQPGYWEVDVDASRAAFEATLREVTAHDDVRVDRPRAISFSSSGREVFPVASDGTPLGPCLMTADVRGDDVAVRTAALHTPLEWMGLVGHVPRRMDPVNRALWWREKHPDVVQRTRWFMNWHEFYALRLAGRPVVDWTDAGTWATYDLETGDWSAERIGETGIDPGWLPDVQPNGSVIGPILPEAATAFGLPRDTLIVTGAYDTFAAAVGSAAIDPGVISLSCGTWHSYNVAIRPGWPTDLVFDGISVLPHPGPTGLGALVTDPNGMSVIDWARDTLGLSLEELESGLARADGGAGHVASDAAFTPLPHVAAGPGFGATLTGLTLATTRIDILRALLEAIAIRFADSLAVLGGHGIERSLIRATGGGSKLDWWLQLQSDLSSVPIEVVDQDEPGAFGAAILAGIGAGVHASVSEAASTLVRVARRYEPEPKRQELYADTRQRIEALRA
jgi:sugar (pentulose or hexulose) kinase